MTEEPTDTGRSLLVAGLQLDIAWEDPEENFRRVEAMATEAVELLAESAGPAAGPATESGDEPGRLLVLPEMFATGFSMDSGKVAAFAKETRAFLAGLARQHRVHVLGGYAEPAEPRPANACSIFDPAGEEILHFRKLHPFTLAGEAESFIAGDALATVEVEGVRVTPFICYDLRFPEPFRAAAEGTDLYCVVANWPSKRIDAWSTLLQARAIENQAFVLGVNRAGEGDGLSYPGASALLDPLGRNAATGALLRPGTGGHPPTEGGSEEIGPQGIVWGRVDSAEVLSVREGLGFLPDRKPQLYQKLEKDRG